MADPMKIRATMKGDIADVRVLMSHPMETGQRKDGDGNFIPAHYIQAITVAINGKVVIEAETSTSVSRNPVFGFKVKGAKIGDKVTISWVDTEGDRRSDEATIT
jgi:sulfur-oxidizing protein SoxZ